VGQRQTQQRQERCHQEGGQQDLGDPGLVPAEQPDQSTQVGQSTEHRHEPTPPTAADPQMAKPLGATEADHETKLSLHTGTTDCLN